MIFGFEEFYNLLAQKQNTWIPANC